MIRFKKIRWKNFLSTGDHWTEVDFLQHNTNLIIGTNGSGKSTMLDALTFVLFNKPFRKITKSQLINTTNEKGTLVEIEFDVNAKDYLIRRGIKPNTFDIEVNGTPLHREADDRSNQRILEETILKVNYKSFTQIIILGSSTFVPFMQLNAPNRREVIEDLLDIRIFSFMNNLLKDKLREKRERVRSLNLKKETLADKIKMQEKFIKEIEDRSKEDIKGKKSKINSLIKETDGYVLTNEEYELEVTGLIEDQDKVAGADKKLRKLNNLKGKISNKVSTITKEHKFFTDNVTCPTCDQDIEESFRLNRIADAQSRAQGYENKNYRNSIDYELIRNRSILHFAKASRQAVAIFEKEVKDAKSERDELTAYYGLGLAYSKDKKHTLALEKMREALNRDSENLILQIGLLELHIAAENFFEAEALASSLLSTNPNNYPISMLYNKVLMNKADYETGEEVLRELTLIRPNDPQVWYWLAEVQGLDKNIIGLHMSRAEYFFLTGSYETSIKHLRMALELTGKNFQLTESIYNKIERSHKSIEALKSVT